jgi:hypothetical protein
MKRGFAPLIIIAIIAAVAIAGAVGYSVWKKSAPTQVHVQQQSPTQAATSTVAEIPKVTVPAASSSPVNNSGWKTYRNDQFGFEMLIPSDFVPKQSTDPVVKQVVFLKSPVTSESDIMMLVEISNLPQNLSLVQAITGGGIDAASIDQSKIGTHQYFKWVSPGQGSGNWAYATYFSGNQVIFISTESRSFASSSDFLKVLASLTFLQPAADASGWKMYTDSTFGYSFSYPAGYSVIANSFDYGWTDQQAVSATGAYDTNANWVKVQTGADNVPHEGDGYGTSTQSFIDKSFLYLKGICDASTVAPFTYADRYCDKISKQSLFVNQNGIACYELYLERVEGGMGATTTIGTVGPLYTCDITAQTPRTVHQGRALLITPRLQESSSGSITLSPDGMVQMKAFINSIHF